MKEAGGGRIINLSSIAGKDGAPNLSHYSASKFAVLGFTKSIAKELAPYDITVNAVCPGIIYSSMWEYMCELRKELDESAEAFWNRTIAERIPLGRPQTPEDIGQAVVFLAGADNITGQAVNVDGGILMQ
jgi:meso-butanediol dehydrogenase/(S,S)-butanediol dehydrogenase/diacetyl reductase